MKCCTDRAQNPRIFVAFLMRENPPSGVRETGLEQVLGDSTSLLR